MRTRQMLQLVHLASVDSAVRVPFLFLLSFLLRASAAWSQPDATIAVKVLNDENQPLPGARVKLLGTQRGAIASPRGIATITKLERGRSYDLEVAYTGFYLDTIRNVIAGTFESQQLTIVLKLRPIERVRLPEESPEYLRGRRKEMSVSDFRVSRDSLARTIITPKPDTTIRIRGGRATETE